jgi:hypothetical protein
MNKLIQQFTEFFEKHEWNYHQYGESPMLHTHFVGEHGRWVGIAIVREEKPDISFLSLFPSRAPAHRRGACAELLTRLNYGLVHGSFQMDMEHGEIRFESSLFAPMQEGTLEQVEHLVFVNVSTTDECYDAIMKVIHGGVSPRIAVAKKKKKAKAPRPKPRFELN